MAGREEHGGTNGKTQRGCRPVDRRVARSRRAIRAAFERLVMERPLDDITVSAIAREADVDRKTFYQHFGSVDGLLDEMALEVVGRVLDDAEAAYRERDVDCARDARALAAFFSGLARALSENLALNRRLLASVPPARARDPGARPRLPRDGRPDLRLLPRLRARRARRRPACVGARGRGRAARGGRHARGAGAHERGDTGLRAAGGRVGPSGPRSSRRRCGAAGSAVAAPHPTAYATWWRLQDTTESGSATTASTSHTAVTAPMRSSTTGPTG